MKATANLLIYVSNKKKVSKLAFFISVFRGSTALENRERTLPGLQIMLFEQSLDKKNIYMPSYDYA